MTEFLIIFLSPLSYRIRGGWFTDLTGYELGNTIERLQWAFFIALSALLLGHGWLSILAGIGAYAGNLLSHGAYFGMARGNAPNPNKWLGNNSTYWQCFRAMAIIGLLRGAAIGLPLGLWYMPLVTAIAHPVAYSCGSTQRGEWIYGAAIGGCLLL